MLIDEIKIFSKEIKSKINFDYNLKKSNWFNIGGKTKVYFKPESLIDLIAFLGQNVSFRIDLNARENFIDLANSKLKLLDPEIRISFFESKTNW